MEGLETLMGIAMLIVVSMNVRSYKLKLKSGPS